VSLEKIFIKVMHRLIFPVMIKKYHIIKRLAEIEKNGSF